MPKGKQRTPVSRSARRTPTAITVAKYTLVGVAITALGTVGAAVLPKMWETRKPESKTTVDVKPIKPTRATGQPTSLPVPAPYRTPVIGWGEASSFISPTLDKCYDGEGPMYLPVWVRYGSLLSGEAQIVRLSDNHLQTPPSLTLAAGGFFCNPIDALPPGEYEISVGLTVMPQGRNSPLTMTTRLTEKLSIHKRLSSGYFLAKTGFGSTTGRSFDAPDWQELVSRQSYCLSLSQTDVAPDWLFEYFIQKAAGSKFSLVANGFTCEINPNTGQVIAFATYGGRTPRTLHPIGDIKPWFMWKTIGSSSHAIFLLTIEPSKAGPRLLVGIQTSNGPQIIGKFAIPRVKAMPLEIGVVPSTAIQFGGAVLGTFDPRLTNAQYVAR